MQITSGRLPLSVYNFTKKMKFMTETKIRKKYYYECGVIKFYGYTDTQHDYD